MSLMDKRQSTADYIEELENKVSELGEFRSSYWGLSKEYEELEKELRTFKDACNFFEGENKRLRKTIERLEFELKKDRDGNGGQRQEGLLKLVREHPELPIVPFVDAEIVADAGGYWLGSFGIVRVDEYLVPLYGDAPVMFKSDNDVFDTLEKCLSDEEFEELPETEGECRAIYEALPWKKAIIVYIDLPE